MQGKLIPLLLLAGFFSQQGLASEGGPQYFICTSSDRGPSGHRAITVVYTKSDGKHGLSMESDSDAHDNLEFWLKVKDGTTWDNYCQKGGKGPVKKNACGDKHDLSFFNKELMVYHREKYICEEVKQLN